MFEPLDSAFPTAKTVLFYSTNGHVPPRLGRAAIITGRGEKTGTCHLTVFPNAHLDCELRNSKAVQLVKNVEMRTDFPEGYTRPFCILPDGYELDGMGGARPIKASKADPVKESSDDEDYVDKSALVQRPKPPADDEAAAEGMTDKFLAEKPAEPKTVVKMSEPLTLIAAHPPMKRVLSEIERAGCKIEYKVDSIVVYSSKKQAVAAFFYDDGPPDGYVVSGYAKDVKMAPILVGLSEREGSPNPQRWISRGIEMLRSLSLGCVGAKDAKQAHKMTKAALAAGES